LVSLILSLQSNDSTDSGKSQGKAALKVIGGFKYPVDFKLKGELF